ncbi:SRPBCC family protein [Actinomadura parmotrematis]|uniref:SRPBCC family protein n=1 Tax=Actinomadura parmotrematis TaxID=2864039 RepID=A0ABS7G2L4_9ACTN|nr:SRPBCC family protein [Actinomadura parmotrematis]MBW8486958.1 SRPBCC family protein [Actinomadura parmotrematis]
MPHHVQATAVVPGSPEMVFRHLAVAEAWNVWGRLPTRARRERAGDTDPDGVGAIRRIFPAREQVVAYEPPVRYSYVALAGLPVRDYRADVELEPRGDATLLTWRGRFEPRIPGTGGALTFFLNRMLHSFATGIARHAERCGPGCPAHE